MKILWIQQKDFYLAVSEDGGNEVDWCIAVTHEEDLLPVVNKFLNDLEEDLDFKNMRIRMN